jgi:hypothetical protein
MIYKFWLTIILMITFGALESIPNVRQKIGTWGVVIFVIIIIPTSIFWWYQNVEELKDIYHYVVAYLSPSEKHPPSSSPKPTPLPSPRPSPPPPPVPGDALSKNAELYAQIEQLIREGLGGARLGDCDLAMSRIGSVSTLMAKFPPLVKTAAACADAAVSPAATAANWATVF